MQATLRCAVVVVLCAARPIFAGQSTGIGDAVNSGFCASPLEFKFVYPVGLAFVSDTNMLVAERAGRLVLLDTATGKTRNVTGLPAMNAGLLDVSAQNDADGSDRVLVSYAVREHGAVVFHVARFRLEHGKAVDVRVLFSSKPPARGRVHFGGAILLLTDETFLLSIGDRIGSNDGQDLRTHLGSIVRVALDGSIPVDNPFLSTPRALAEIYSFGHRNVQGLALDHRTGAIWATEHGPTGGDEINRIEAGANYGWPVFSNGQEQAENQSELAQGREIRDPVRRWSPSIAPSGAIVYSGKGLPQWAGDLLIASLSQMHVRRVAIGEGGEGGEEMLLQEFGERFRDVAEDSVGDVYALTDASSARVIRLAPCSGRGSTSVAGN